MDVKDVAPEPAEAQLTDRDALAVPRPSRPPAPIHQPARALVAFVEIVLVVTFCLAAAWAWRRASIPYELPMSENPAMPRTVDRWSGPWVGVAFGLTTLAGWLLLDAARQLVLAIRVSQRRSQPESVAQPWQTASHGRDNPHGGAE
jgi:hypothetical protein